MFKQTQRLGLIQKQVPALQCSVCEQLVLPSEVFVGSLPLLVLQLKEVRFRLCPSCTQEVTRGIWADKAYQARWVRSVRAMIAALKRGVKWHQFRPKSN